ncbi:MAG: DUF5597 domain-containing protein [Bacteroidales bacterium]|nr:DUF5597 domain-containing protein [Bacteroidales bacterium]
MVKQGTATQLIVDGSPFLMLAGELHNSSMGGIEYMRPIWKRMADANLNTLISTASWELVEPEEGRFNFEHVDSMIIGARKAGLKLVVIWFASWKNSASSYVPSWVKLDKERFPLVKDEQGNTLNILSTFSEESCNADAKAFAALMEHIRQIDGEHHTVVMMQVQNEIGTLRTKRDYSEPANAAFYTTVPAELMDYLNKNRDSLHPGVLEAWGKQGFPETGTWEEVFGKGVLVDDWKGMSYLTEELFMAWNYAKYVGKIAEAGREKYDIPMYVNAWLKQPGSSGHAPGNYPSGGPTPQVIDVWRAGAPSIDFIAPDIYIVDHFRYICDQYTLSGNPLFIPETRGDAGGASRAFFAYGKYNAMCYAPFGIDGGDAGASVEDISDMKDAYGTLKQLTTMILHNQGTQNINGLMVDNNSGIDSMVIGGYEIRGTLPRRFRFAEAGIPGGQGAEQQNRGQTGGCLIISTGPGEYIVAGRNMSLTFAMADPESNQNVDFLSLEDGTYVKDQWITGRRLNGDERRVNFPADRSKIFKLSLYSY